MRTGIKEDLSTVEPPLTATSVKQPFIFVPVDGPNIHSYFNLSPTATRSTAAKAAKARPSCQQQQHALFSPFCYITDILLFKDKKKRGLATWNNHRQWIKNPIFFVTGHVDWSNKWATRGTWYKRERCDVTLAEDEADANWCTYFYLVL